MTSPLAEGVRTAGSADVGTEGGLVRPLPPTHACAKTARSIVTDALKALIPQRLDDAVTMASELATNAWRHALGGEDLDEKRAPAAGRSEIMIYRRGLGARAEIVVTVFDPDPRLDRLPTVIGQNALTEIPDLPLTETLPAAHLDRLLDRLEERRRGLDVVQELSANRHGFYRTRSRLGQWPVSGKAAWFAIPLPPRAPEPPSADPGQAAQDLHAQLEARRLGRIYSKELPDRSMLSLPDPYLTIWCAEQTFSWRHNGRSVSYPFADLTEVVERLVEIAEDRAADRRAADERANPSSGDSRSNVAFRTL